MISTKIGSENTTASEWFLLLGERYQGPFSQDDVLQKIEEGCLAQNTLAWRQGMTDWEPLKQITLFGAAVENLPAELPAGLFAGMENELDFVDKPSHSADFTSEEIASAARNSTIAQAPKNSESIPEETVSNAFPSVAPPPAFFTEPAWDKFLERQPFPRYEETTLKKLSRRWSSSKSLRLATVTGAIAGVAIVTFLATTFAQRSIPHLEDASREENRELQAAVRESYRTDAPAIAIAMSRADLFAPNFYLATNLPDGATLDVLIEGVPETLLERFRLTVRASAVVRNGLARTPAFRQENGLPFPRGEYRISVSCGSCDKSILSQGNGRVLTQKTYFIGGVKDADYDQKLATYHEQLRIQAQDELGELKQVLETLEAQFRETTQRYRSLLETKGVPSTADAKTWASFSGRWSGLQAQINSLFARWTPEALEAGYFHASLYSSLKMAGERVQRLHKTQSAAFEARPPFASGEAAIETEITGIQNSLETLRTKVERALTLPPTANGMPQRP